MTGTHPSGEPYAGAGALDIVLGTSGALELVWDNGKSVGVGQVIGNVLAVASSTRGRTVILMMNINPDGSLSARPRDARTGVPKAPRPGRGLDPTSGPRSILLM